VCTTLFGFGPSDILAAPTTEVLFACEHICTLGVTGGEILSAAADFSVPFAVTGWLMKLHCWVPTVRICGL
jgi:hypothetical protein